MGDKSVEALQRISSYVSDGLLTVGSAVRVAQIDDVFVRHKVDDRSSHRQPSESGVEDADRRVDNVEIRFGHSSTDYRAISPSDHSREVTAPLPGRYTPIGSLR